MRKLDLTKIVAILTGISLFASLGLAHAATGKRGQPESNSQSNDEKNPSATAGQSSEPQAKRARTEKTNTVSALQISEIEDKLPDEILMLIFNQLDPHVRSQTQLVNKRWYQISNDEFFVRGLHEYLKIELDALANLDQEFREQHKELYIKLEEILGSEKLNKIQKEFHDEIKKLLFRVVKTLDPKALAQLLDHPWLPLGDVNDINSYIKDENSYISKRAINNLFSHRLKEIALKAAEGEDPLALINAGRILTIIDEKQPEIAFHYFERAAEEGSAEGLYWLGWAYKKGIGTKKNTEKAFSLFEEATGDDNPRALFKLGEWFQDASMYGAPQAGLGEPYIAHSDRELDQASYYFYSRAMMQGNTRAFTSLAAMYYEGLHSIKEDPKIAARLYKKALKKKDAWAEYMIAHMYEFGEGGLEKNREKAIEYFLRSFLHGDPTSNALTRLYEAIDAGESASDSDKVDSDSGSDSEN